jgi:CubicO group peptidase (beta-lactamase class C family)
MRADDTFRPGSIIKPFIATVVLQLVEEGKLALGDRLPAVLPHDVVARFTNADWITVRMLLDHTSPARWDAGSTRVFVGRMNAMARALGLKRTTSSSRRG